MLDDVNGHLYWNDFGQANAPDVNPGRTLRSNLDGSNVIPLVDDHGQAGVNDIDLDRAAGHVYMALFPDGFDDFGGVRRVNLDGTGLIDVPVPGKFLDGLAVEPVMGHLFYGEPGDLSFPFSLIDKTNLDGTGRCR